MIDGFLSSSKALNCIHLLKVAPLLANKPNDTKLIYDAQHVILLASSFCVL